MTKAKPLPSQELLRERFNYEPETGRLIYRTAPKWNSQLLGKEAGCIGGKGYRKVKIDRNLYLTHRLIWVIQTSEDPGSLQVDHKNGNRSDNWWSNLRLGTQSQNQFNRAANKGRDLPKGVHLKPSGRFCAAIVVGGEKQNLGTFDTPEEAHQAYCMAAQKLHGKFWRAA